MYICTVFCFSVCLEINALFLLYTCLDCDHFVYGFVFRGITLNIDRVHCLKKFVKRRVELVFFGVRVGW